MHNQTPKYVSLSSRPLASFQYPYESKGTNNYNHGLHYITHRISNEACISIDIILGEIVIILWLPHESSLMAILFIQEETQRL